MVPSRWSPVLGLIRIHPVHCDGKMGVGRSSWGSDSTASVLGDLDVPYPCSHEDQGEGEGEGEGLAMPRCPHRRTVRVYRPDEFKPERDASD